MGNAAYILSGIQPTYGDGSKNTTENGYTDLLYNKNGLITDEYPIYGNCKNIRYLFEHHWHTINPDAEMLTLGQNTSAYPYEFEAYKLQRIYAGTNEYVLQRETNTNKWIFVTIRGGGRTTSVYVGAFKIKINGIKYTLQAAVAAGLVEPLVIISSLFSWNVLNLYNGGNTTTISYPEGYIAFKTKSQVSAVEFYSSQNFDTQYDGLQVVEFNTWEASTALFSDKKRIRNIRHYGSGWSRLSKTQYHVGMNWNRINV